MITPKELIDAVFAHLDTLSYRETRKFLGPPWKFGYPRFLYKFRALTDREDVNRLRDILVKSNLWLSSPDKFNDPFDMTAKFIFEASEEAKLTRFREALELRGVSAKEIETLLPQFMARGDKENKAAAAEVHQVMVKQIGVCSIAGDPRSILMWTHYALNQTGICLVFELARDPKIFVQAFKVSYTDEYPIVNWYTDFAHFGHKIALRKHPMWRYEDERRIVLVDRAA